MSESKKVTTYMVITTGRKIDLCPAHAYAFKHEHEHDWQGIGEPKPGTCQGCEDEVRKFREEHERSKRDWKNKP